MASTSRGPRWHYAILAIWPLLLTLLNRNWAFGDLENYDAWYYFGDFLHFPRIHLLSPEYPHERVAWILPGYTLVHAFGSVWGIFVLHCLTVWAGLFLMYYILARVTDARTALLGTAMLGCSSSFLGPNGWTYPDGLLMACVFAAVAVLVRRPDDAAPGAAAVLVCGAAIATMTSLYLLWICLAPAYLFLMLRVTRVREFRWPAALRVSGIAAAGGAAAGLAMWGIYLAMGGRGFFFARNLHMARGVAGTGNLPWVLEDWIREPVWLVLPALAVCAAAIGLVEYSRRPGGLARTHRDLLWFYLLCMAIMVALTIHSARILALGFKTNVLVPPVFLTFALVIFRVPSTVPAWLFCLTGSLAVGVSLVSLAVPGLFRIAYHREFLIPAFALLLAVTALRLRRPSHALWCAGVLLFAAASFGILPSYYRAWMFSYRGSEVTERVSRATRIILARLPANALPVFWYQSQSARLSSEFQGIMCAFMGGPLAMLDFPKVDRPLRPGTRLFLLRDRMDEAPLAKYLSALAGTPLVEKSRDKVAFGEEAYWIIQFEAQVLSLAAVREGLVPVPGAQDVDYGNDTWKPMRLDAAGSYQFELRYARGGCTSRFIAVSDANAPAEESGAVAPDGGDEVAWFRMAAGAGDLVRLKAVWACPENVKPAPAKVSVWRDPSGAALAALNITRKWTAEGVVQLGSGCHGGECVEFLPGRGIAPSLYYRSDLRIAPGVPYELNAWIRSATGQAIRLECGMWDAAHSRWAASQNFTATAEWSNVRVRFQGGAEGALTPAFRQSLSDPGTMLVDEVQVKLVPRVESADTLIPNGGFENGLAGWDSLKGKIREATDCHRGSCVEFLPLGKEMQYVVGWNAFTPVPGKTYEFSAWIRSGTGQPLRMQWGFWDQKANQWVAPQTYAATPEWTKVTNRFRRDTAEKLSPIFWQSQGDYGSMFVDEVELQEVKQ